MKNENIDNILEELCRFDPSLRERETDLRRAVERLLAEKPEAELDTVSFERIRREVLGFARENPPARPFVLFINKFAHMKKVYIGLGAAVLVLAVTTALVPQFTKINSRFTAIQNAGTSAPVHKMKANQIEKVSLGAFGDLSALNIAGGAIATGGDAAKGNAASMARGMGGGGAVGNPQSFESSKIGIMPPDEYPVFRYSYKGDEVKLDKEVLPVYKRVKGFDIGALEGVIGNLNFSMIDLAKLKDAKLQSLSLMQDSDFGLYAYIDFVEGTVSMSENWLKWRNLEAEKCTDDACWAKFSMKYDQFPADTEIVALADGLLADYAVDRSVYGPGEVEDYWRRDYERAADRSNAYVPDAVTVVYPYLLDGQVVRDQSGNKSGLRVNVNVKVKRASGLYGLTTNNYQASDYATVQDFANVIKVAEKSGNGLYYTDNVSKTKYIDLDLGTPELSYVQTFDYDQTTGLTNELLVPALIFPVMSNPDAKYNYQRQIVVPIAKEMFDKLSENQEPTPIPLVEPAVSPMVKTLDLPAREE